MTSIQTHLHLTVSLPLSPITTPQFEDQAMPKTGIDHTVRIIALAPTLRADGGKTHPLFTACLAGRRHPTTRETTPW